MRSIPFSLPKVYEGFAKADGLARYEGDTLCLEFQIKDSFGGLFKSDVKEVVLRLEDLEAVNLKHRMFRSTLTFSVRSLEAVEAIPARQGNEVRLRFKRQYRRELDVMTSSLSLAISEARLVRLDEEPSWLDG